MQTDSQTEQAPPGSLPPAGPDPYDVFFRWCDAHGFPDVGSGPVADMEPRRFVAAMAAYRWDSLTGGIRR